MYLTKMSEFECVGVKSGQQSELKNQVAQFWDCHEIISVFKFQHNSYESKARGKGS